MQPDREGVITSEANQVSLIRNLEGDLRKPWLHLSGHQHIMDAIGQTSWLPSEGRLVSGSRASLATSMICASWRASPSSIDIMERKPSNWWVVPSGTWHLRRSRIKCSSEFVETSHRSLIRSTERTSTSGTTICAWTSGIYLGSHQRDFLENHPPSAEEHPCVPSYLMEEDIEMEEDNEPSSAAAFNILWGNLRMASSFVNDAEKECHRNQISIDEI